MKNDRKVRYVNREEIAEGIRKQFAPEYAELATMPTNSPTSVGTSASAVSQKVSRTWPSQNSKLHLNLSRVRY